MWRQLVNAINLIPVEGFNADMVENGARVAFSRFTKVWSDGKAERTLPLVRHDGGGLKSP